MSRLTNHLLAGGTVEEYRSLPTDDTPRPVPPGTQSDATMWAFVHSRSKAQLAVLTERRAETAWAVAFEHALALQCELAGGHEGQSLGYTEPTPAMTKAAKAWADDVAAAARTMIG